MAYLVDMPSIRPLVTVTTNPVALSPSAERFNSLLVRDVRVRLMVVLAAAWSMAGSAAAAWDADKVREQVLGGVEAIGEPGVVGFVAVWGEHAVPLVLGRSGSDLLPIAAAAQSGAGRVAALAHDYGSASALQQHDTARFMANLCRWAGARVHDAGDAERSDDKQHLAGAETSLVRVGLLESGAAAALSAAGLEVIVLDQRGDALAHALITQRIDVVLCGRTSLGAADTAALGLFVDAGGGFIGCSCPWGWAQVHRRPVAEHPFGPILARGGLALADGYAGATVGAGFAVGGAEREEFTGTAALDLLLRKANGEAVHRRTIRQAGRTMQLIAEVLPENDKMMRPQLEALRGARGMEQLPSPADGVGQEEGLARLLIALDLDERERLEPEDVRAHPAAEFFPGAVPGDAARVARDVVIDGRTPRWQSTGLYAAPGEVITIARVDAGEDAGPADELRLMRVRIGAHTDEIWHHATWNRVPRISRSWPLATSGETAVASPFGGLLYIEVPPRGPERAVTLRVAGVVEAPVYVLGETDAAAWRAMVARSGAPWAELACDGLVLTVPRETALRISDPQPLMEHWQRVMDACADLATMPRARSSPERIVSDVQISAGYMHAGYPIMTHLDAADFMTDMQGVYDHGWGPYHEIGHNHQSSDWTFDGTVEVTVNLFTLYVFEHVCGIRPHETGRVLTRDTLEKARAHIAAGAPFDRWKGDPFLALEMYAFMIRDFGWDTFKRVFAEYRDLPAAERPRSDDEKRDQWLVRFSRAAGRNLGPYFELWGVPTSRAARESISALPVWMPQEFAGG